jgi:2-oxoglutarate dehydrogenase E1 component
VARILGSLPADQELTLPEELGARKTTLSELNSQLKKMYCGTAGFEFMHLSNAVEVDFMVREIENLQREKVTPERKKWLLKSITKVEAFNHFLNDKYKTSKRFGVEGLDSFVCGLESLVESAIHADMKHVDFGMAHRGRLCTLAMLFDKPMEEIFGEFQEMKSGHEEWGNSGDVKYHLGVVDQKTIDGKTITLSILPNPSHLEAVNPVVLGSNRAVQDYLGDRDGSKAMNVIIHGDAAVAGQGIVYETAQMMNLESFRTHGTIHIVANNQIGFTTTPAEARTGLYCTDVAKAIGAPIIHVNADDLETVDKVVKIAFKYRQNFKKDIFVDIVGYRRYGHN